MTYSCLNIKLAICIILMMPTFWPLRSLSAKLAQPHDLMNNAEIVIHKTVTVFGARLRERLPQQGLSIFHISM